MEMETTIQKKGVCLQCSDPRNFQECAVWVRKAWKQDTKAGGKTDGIHSRARSGAASWTFKGSDEGRQDGNPSFCEELLQTAQYIQPWMKLPYTVLLRDASIHTPP